jgi:sugar (pentulose or hexulose) kinase
MIADASGLRVHVPEGTQFGARGAALLAATAAGHFRSVAEASASVAGRGGVTYHPDTQNASGTAAAILRYREARDRLLRPLSELS